MPEPSLPPPIVLLGATGTGKSALALTLCSGGTGEIVNADALQVYRGFDLGTAKPTAPERQRVRHHLIDILEPEERFSAGEFARRADDVLRDLALRSARAWVVGGSGLYLRALFDGLAPIPPVDREVRMALESRASSDGLPSLYRELQGVDPTTAARLASGDSQRVLRALAVAIATGRPLSSWIADRPFGTQARPTVRIGLTLSRTVLYDRIARRIDEMLRRGWAEEVRSLLERGVSPSAPAFQAIGYRQLVEWVAGRRSWEQVTDEIRLVTRRFAKRQETWFRREHGVEWFDAEDFSNLPDRVSRFLEKKGWGEP